MNASPHSPRALHPTRLGARRFVLGAVASTLIAGCGDSVVSETAAGKARAAQLAFTTSISASVGRGSDVATVNAVSSYLRQDGSAVRIGAQTLQLDGATQSLPLAIDLAGCLSDPQHDAGDAKSCVVKVNLALHVNAVLVDEQVIGPLQLTPGVVTRVSDPVTLFELTSIDVALGNGPVLGPGEELTGLPGQSLALRAELRERNGTLVTDRAVTWSSDAPAVATVVATAGQVSMLGVGSARITASIGTLARQVTVDVKRPAVALTIAANAGSGAGSIRSRPAGIECRVEGGTLSGDCSATFPADATVLLTSVADADSRFSIWGGACGATGAGSDCELAMSQARSASARFIAVRRFAIVAGSGDGRGRVTGSLGLDCRIDDGVVTGTCSAEAVEGSSVTLTADPTSSSGGLDLFGGWQGDCASAGGRSCTVTIGTGNRTAVVSFLSEKALDVTVAGSGSGDVTSAGGLSCRRAAGVTSGRCREAAVTGTSITLRATAAAQSVFAGWGGDCAAEAGDACLTTLSQSRTVTAQFTALRRLSVRSAGTAGRGRVTGSRGLNCLIAGTVTSGVRAVNVPDDAGATMNAAPEAGGGAEAHVFDGWGGACASASGATCTVSFLGSDREATVRFLTGAIVGVEFFGTGGGSVTSVIGISCARVNGATSGICAEAATPGSTVTLTAVPDAQSQFVDWSGACAGQFGTVCRTTVSGSTTATAHFVKRRVNLTLVTSGSGGGQLTVNKEPPCVQIAGGSRTCQFGIDMGSTVTFTAQAASGATFASFGGDCSGTSTCTVSASRALTVTGQFTQIDTPPATVTLSVALSGPGAGFVTGLGIECTRVDGVNRGACTATIAYGTTVTLIATPDANSALNAWGGACNTQQGNQCALTLTANRSVAVVFRAKGQ